MGSFIKDNLSKKWQIPPKSIYHLTIMPCFDKKLEASRGDFYNESMDAHDVDMVITTVEIEHMLQEDNIHLEELNASDLDYYITGTVTHITTHNCHFLIKKYGKLYIKGRS